MGRVINPESAGKERTQMMRGVILALRELMAQATINETTRDLAAFVALSLEAIWGTVDLSVTAWEKRGYWVKADRFRMEWQWTERLGVGLRQAVLADDWVQVAGLSAQVAEKVHSMTLPKRHGLGTPWVGAWKRLRDKAF